jgi:ABC-2 type transport system permease protein
MIGSAFSIAKREVYSFFVSPLAWVLLTTWVFLCGGYFTLLAWWAASQPFSGDTDQSPLSQFFGTTLFYVLVLVFVPILTMRLVADETRTGSIESLLTAPVTEASVIVGKFLAAVVFWIAMWAPTLMYVWVTSDYGRVDAGTIASTYLGVFTLGLSWMSIGLLMSTLAKHQMVAALLTFMALMAHFLLGIGEFVASDEASRQVIEYISVWGHIRSYARGVVDSRCLIFDLSITLVSILSSIGVLQVRRYES